MTRKEFFREINDQTRLRVLDFNEALDMAFADLFKNWQEYAQAYVKDR